MRRSKEMVFCTNDRRDTMDFFLCAEGKVMYLFTTRYYSSEIYSCYKNGQRLEKAFENTSMIRQQHLRERILRMSKYVAAEEGITLTSLERQPRKGERYDRRVQRSDRYDDYEAA